MNPLYTLEQLESYKRPQLWEICRINGLKCHSASADCVEAILTHQSAQVEKVAVAEVKLASQAAPQPEEITTVEITFCDREIYVSGKQIAAITYDMDDFATQRWVVMVGKTEVHRADSWAKCHSYITWHYKQGTLPVAEPTPTEAQATEVIELEAYKLVHIGGAATRNYRVYKGDSLRGLVWQHVTYWLDRGDDVQHAEPYLTYWSNGIDNVRHTEPLQAVMALDKLVDVKPASCEELLNKPFDELTAFDWQRLKEYEPRSVAELVAA